jgi:hypothetical protein
MIRDPIVVLRGELFDEKVEIRFTFKLHCQVFDDLPSFNNTTMVIWSIFKILKAACDLLLLTLLDSGAG